MNKLANLALGGIVAASLATNGCYGIIYVHEHVRPRVVHHEHPRNDAPMFVICYEWPSHDYYCHHQSCLDRYLIEFRHRNDQHRSWGQYFTPQPERPPFPSQPMFNQPERQAFPHQPKAKRQRMKLEIEKKKPKEYRTAFPQLGKPKRHFQEVDANIGP